MYLMVRIVIRLLHQRVEIPTMILGHYGDTVSEYASKNLIKEVDVQVSAVIFKNPNILGDAIPICRLHHSEIRRNPP